VPDRIHALIDAMQPSARHPLVDDLHVETELDELAQRNQPILRLCKLSDQPISRSMGRFPSI
jgi:hypothetical protein